MQWANPTPCPLPTGGGECGAVALTLLGATPQTPAAFAKPKGFIWALAQNLMDFAEDIHIAG